MKKILKVLYLAARTMLLAPCMLFKKSLPLEAGSIKTILVVRHDRIGDMVLCTPLFAALKKHMPAATLIVVASESNQDILRHNPYVDEVIVYKNLRSFLRKTRARTVDLAIDPFVSYALMPALLTYACGARYRIGFAIASRQLFFNTEDIPFAAGKHMTEYMAELLKPLGISPLEAPPAVYLDEKEIAWAKKYLASQGNTQNLHIALHPGGFYPSQRWPADNFASLAKILIDRYRACVYILGDKQEEARCRGIEKTVAREKLQVCCGFTLRETMAMVSQCALLVSNNSSLLHIACALGIPTVSTMGPTDPALWRPQGNKHIVLRKGLACSPCDKASCADHACLAQISVEEMAQAVEKQLCSIVTR